MTDKETVGDVIVRFEHHQGTFLSPRGRYMMELYKDFVRIRDRKDDYRINYDDIDRFFLLPKADQVHMTFVMVLEKPLRQGKHRYRFLVLQSSALESQEITLLQEEQTLQNEYDGELQPIMRESISNLIAKTFEVIARKKVFRTGMFMNAHEQAYLKCFVRANEGLLYPLDGQFIFIGKAPIHVLFHEVESVQFQRDSDGKDSTRNFDLSVTLKPTVAASSNTRKAIIFSGMDGSDYVGLYNFLAAAKIPITGGTGSADPERATTTNQSHSAGKRVRDRNNHVNDADDDDDDDDDDDYEDDRRWPKKKATTA